VVAAAFALDVCAEDTTDSIDGSMLEVGDNRNPNSLHLPNTAVMISS
jgi:hypothetical protein